MSRNIDGIARQLGITPREVLERFGRLPPERAAERRARTLASWLRHHAPAG